MLHPGAVGLNNFWTDSNALFEIVPSNQARISFKK